MLCCHVDHFPSVLGRSIDSIFGVYLCPLVLLLPFSVDFKSPQSASLSQRQLLSGSETELNTCYTKGIPGLLQRAVWGGVPCVAGCTLLWHNWCEDHNFAFSSLQMPLTVSWSCRHLQRSCRGRLCRSQFMTLSLIPGEHMSVLHVRPAPISMCSFTDNTVTGHVEQISDVIFVLSLYCTIISAYSH